MKVGFIGLGKLGMPCAEAIAKKGFHVAGYDIKSKTSDLVEITTSLSCLHALEHFGLGRYGDPLDVNGDVKGLKNCINMVKPGGVIYLSVPVAIKDSVHFNAHRIYNPHTILNWEATTQLNLLNFDLVNDDGKLEKNFDIMNKKIDCNYGCGIYTFKKK